MAVEQSDLIERLQSGAPAKDGIPAEYLFILEEAVAKLGQDVPLRSSATVAVVAGQATYVLPDDFLRLVQLAPLPYSADGVMVSDVLTPVGVAMKRERVIVEGDSLRIEPTPAYSMQRTLEYEAIYALVDGAYPRLTQNGARLALLYARHLVLGQQAGVAAGKAWRFKIGDEEVDRSKTGDAVGSQATALLQQYEREIAGMRKGGGVRSQYGSAEFVEVFG